MNETTLYDQHLAMFRNHPVFVVDGDPDGVKIVDRQNWTGWGIAFPRSHWPNIAKRREFETAGVYILTGTAEGAEDDLPMVYPSGGCCAGHHARTSLYQFEPHVEDKDRSRVVPIKGSGR